MHGTVMLTNRRGRKRKFRGSKPGLVVEVVELNPRTIAASMPHRRELPEAVRHDQKAVSELGRMYLFGRKYGDKEDCVSDEMELAGNMFLGHYGAFMATTGGPRTGAGNGRGFDCIGEPDEFDEMGRQIKVGCKDCECARRKASYTGALDALKKAGTVAVKAVFLVAIHDRRCPPKWETNLLWGLAALVKHYGLTARRK